VKTAEIPDQGTIDETLPAPGDPSYQSESLALVIKKMFAALRTEGFVFERADSSDFADFGNEFQTGIDNYITRYEQILADGASSVVASIPDVLPIMAALLSGGATPVLAILLQGVVDTMLRHTNASSTATQGEAIVEKLEELRALVEEGRDDFRTFGVIDGEYSRLESFFSKLTINLSMFDDLLQSISFGNTGIED
jgi:hypothetical protein